MYSSKLGCCCVSAKSLSVINWDSIGLQLTTTTEGRHASKTWFCRPTYQDNQLVYFWRLQPVHPGGSNSAKLRTLKLVGNTNAGPTSSRLRPLISPERWRWCRCHSTLETGTYSAPTHTFVECWRVQKAVPLYQGDISKLIEPTLTDLRLNY